MKTWHGITLAILLSISGIFLLAKDKTTTPVNNAQQATNNPYVVDHEYHQNTAEGSPNSGINLNDPNLSVEVKEFLKYEDLQNSVAYYFDNYLTLPDAEKTLAANRIYTEINNLESRKEIIPLEALSLKLALLKTTTDESEYPELAKELTADYQEKISAEEPLIDHNKNTTYKQREREVLLEVQAMSQYPDDMSQSEYLRHRLQLLRTEVFDDGN